MDFVFVFVLHADSYFIRKAAREYGERVSVGIRADMPAGTMPGHNATE